MCTVSELQHDENETIKEKRYAMTDDYVTYSYDVYRKWHQYALTE